MNILKEKIEYLLELAQSWKDIVSYIRNRWDITTNHLLKIFYWSNAEEINHWINEVYSNLNRVYKVSSSKRYPKIDKLLSVLWYESADMMDDIIRTFIEDANDSTNEKYNKLPNIKDDRISEATEFCRKYYFALAEKLSESGNVSNLWVKNTIHNLLKKGN